MGSSNKARQRDIIRWILEHYGLWQDPRGRGPPRATGPSHPGDLASDPSSRLTCQFDPDPLEYARREQLEQLELPQEP